MIRISELTNKDRGKTVWYKPGYGKPELGIIKSWNASFIFVVYPGKNQSKRDFYENYTAAATNPADLYWKLQEVNSP